MRILCGDYQVFVSVHVFTRACIQLSDLQRELENSKVDNDGLKRVQAALEETVARCAWAMCVACSCALASGSVDPFLYMRVLV